MINLKTKIKNNKITLGTWQTIPSNSVSDILSSLGLDWIAVDIEHTSIDLNNLDNILNSINRNNVTPLVRVGEINSNLIKRILDIGYQGVIVPNIENKDQALSVINSVHYPPLGKRGMGLYRAQKFGDNLNSYISNSKKNNIIILQIENIITLKNLDELFSIKNIDGFFIGPYDLSASMGIPGQFDHKDYKNCLNFILKKAKKYKKPLGIHSVSSSLDDVNKYIKMGFKIIGYCMDTIAIKESYSKNISKIIKKYN